jgi:hypothetical protein
MSPRLPLTDRLDRVRTYSEKLGKLPPGQAGSPNLHNRCCRQPRLAVPFTDCLLTCGLLVVAWLAPNHTLRQFSIASRLGPRPYPVTHLGSGVSVINLKLPPGTAVNAGAMRHKPLVPARGYPLALVIALLSRISVRHG